MWNYVCLLPLMESNVSCVCFCCYHSIFNSLSTSISSALTFSVSEYVQKILPISSLDLNSYGYVCVHACKSLCGVWISSSNWVKPLDVCQDLLVRAIHDTSRLPVLSPSPCPPSLSLSLSLIESGKVSYQSTRWASTVQQRSNHS